MFTHEITSHFENVSLEQLREFCFDPWTFPRIFPEPITSRSEIDLTKLKLELYQQFEFIHWSWGVIPLPWAVKIVELSQNHFVDQMVSGPFRNFRHEHIISGEKDHPVYTDRLIYDPIGGTLANSLFVKSYLKSIFLRRHQRMKTLLKERLKQI
jgi:ligand-binding SRPBCC domain-containing protein